MNIVIIITSDVLEHREGRRYLRQLQRAHLRDVLGLFNACRMHSTLSLEGISLWNKAFPFGISLSLSLYIPVGTHICTYEATTSCWVRGKHTSNIAPFHWVITCSLVRETFAARCIIRVFDNGFQPFGGWSFERLRCLQLCYSTNEPRDQRVPNTRRRYSRHYLRPIFLLRLSLLRFVDSTFPGNSPLTWEFHPLRLRFCLS